MTRFKSSSRRSQRSRSRNPGPSASGLGYLRLWLAAARHRATLNAADARERALRRRFVPA